MYKIGTPWETDQFTFCVVDTTFYNEYQTDTGDIITPDEGCRFIAVEYDGHLCTKCDAVGMHAEKR